MNEYVKSLLEMAEQASSPATPDTGFGKVYFKSDGNLYIKDDTGTETQITGGSSGSGGVDEYQWTPKELSATVTGRSVPGTNTVNYAVLADGVNGKATTPWFRLTQTMADAIAGGDSLWFSLEAISPSTGDAVLSIGLSSWDDSGDAFGTVENQSITPTFSTANKFITIEQEMTLAPAVGDLLSFQVSRTGGDASDTLGGDLEIGIMRVFTKAGAGS